MISTDITLAASRLALEHYGSVRLVVISRSMMPMLHIGDQILVCKADPADIYQGDLVVVDQGNELITHRVVSVQDRSFITKGDWALGSDICPVSAPHILGSVQGIWRKRGSAERYSGFQGQHWYTYHRWMGKLNWRQVCWVDWLAGQEAQTSWQTWKKRFVAVPFRMIYYLLTMFVFTLDKLSGGSRGNIMAIPNP